MTVNRTVNLPRYPDVRVKDVDSGLTLAAQFTTHRLWINSLDSVTTSVQPLLLAVFSISLKSSAIDWHSHKQVLDLICSLGRPHPSFISTSFHFQLSRTKVITSLSCLHYSTNDITTLLTAALFDPSKTCRRSKRLLQHPPLTLPLHRVRCRLLGLPRHRLGPLPACLPSGVDDSQTLTQSQQP
jgi:hypothetical protein